MPGAASRLPISHDRADVHIAARLRADQNILKLHEAKVTKSKNYDYGYANRLGARRARGRFGGMDGALIATSQQSKQESGGNDLFA
ncbi:MAG: hypothetical protein ACRECN_07895 [Methylocella sp.]